MNHETQDMRHNKNEKYLFEFSVKECSFSSFCDALCVLHSKIDNRLDVFLISHSFSFAFAAFFRCETEEEGDEGRRQREKIEKLKNIRNIRMH